ncbi:hypothetical protein ACLK1T_21765 [Escherichia coli]
MHYQEMHCYTPFIYQSPLNWWFFLLNGLLVISLQMTYHRGLILMTITRARNIQHAAGGLPSGSVNAYLPVLSHPYPPFRELLHKSAHYPKELLAVTAIFSPFALFSTWSGVPVEARW